MQNVTLQTILNRLDCQYSFYFREKGKPETLRSNCDRFLSASIIKLPILLSWLVLEKTGQVSRSEMCNLNAEPQVKGAGISWLLQGRLLPYNDILLMMMALSDNLCTNLIIQKAGLESINRIFHQELGLKGTDLQRKLFDYEARSRGSDNWITTQDAIQLYSLVQNLAANDRQWVEELLAANQDDALLKRNIPRDTIDFFHKTGSITGVLHDWGYTNDCDIFLLTQGVKDETSAFEVFGQLGEFMIPQNRMGTSLK